MSGRVMDVLEDRVLELGPAPAADGLYRGIGVHDQVVDVVYYCPGFLHLGVMDFCVAQNRTQGEQERDLAKDEEGDKKRCLGCQFELQCPALSQNVR